MTVRVLAMSAVALAVFAALDLLLATPAGSEEIWYHVPAFFALFGLVGSLVIVLASRGLGRFLLQRPEDHDGAD